MPKLSLDKEIVDWTIKHILAYGDTDIFPYPFELRFISDKSDILSDKISELNLYTYRPISLVESLTPKSRFGFRMAHQMYPIDSIVFLATVISIAQDLEGCRVPIGDGVAYAYRYAPDGTNYRLFSKEHRYKDWLTRQFVTLAFSEEYTHVIKTDISDFYQRIYHHRLENCIKEYSEQSPYCRIVTNSLRDWRSRQSFGIPVGSNACRILAEALLSDTDNALLSEGYEFTRYVDDFVIFVKANQDPYAALAYLASHLAVNEGLALSMHKTKIYDKREYLSEHNLQSGEDADQVEQSSIETLYWNAYGHEEVDEDQLRELQAVDLAGELEAEVAKIHWDTGRIRILLRALRLTKSKTASRFLRDHLKELIPFPKDIVLLFDELLQEENHGLEGLKDDVLSILVEPAVGALPMVRSWFFELFIRGRLEISGRELRAFEGLQDTLELRQLYLIRGTIRDLNFFRRGKARIDELNVWEQSAYIYGAMCLPSDEYDAWIGSIKGRLRFPFSELFCDWCLQIKRQQ